ncbi:hypothetical protein ACRS3X_25780 [Ectopseudomonas hydrolytica]|uniref:hypothetical protein n=1 Tax=Ectopseudomonas hydrolytica TaxID=2493633 RepID=UPI003EDEE57D
MARSKGLDMRSLCALMGLSLGLSGCSIVSISGATTTERFINFGPVTLKTEQPARAIVATTFSVGATNFHGTTNIGYLDQEVVVVPSPATCQLILVVRNHQELERAKQVLGDALEQTCINDKETL